MNVGGIGVSLKTLLNTDNTSNFVKTDTTKTTISYETPVKLMTGQELVAKMGTPPHEGFTLFGKVFHRSTEYKGALDGLQKFENLTRRVENQSVGSARPNVQEMQEALVSARDSCNKYIEKHSGDQDKAGRSGVMKELKSTLDLQIKFFDRLVADLPNFDSSMRFGTATAIVNGGLDDTSLINKSMSDQNLIGNPRPLGSGAINTVSLATYRTEDGGTETRVLKPLINSKGPGMGKDSFVGIDEQDLRAGQRNIASASVANLLGRSDIIPKPDIVIHDGQLCLAMPLAEGEDLIGSHFHVLPQSSQQDIDDMERRGDKLGLEAGQYARNTEGTWCKKLDAVRDFAVISSEPSELTGNLQKSMLDLQVVDLLCGQVDRHQHNFLIQVDGNEVKLTGIDNDTSFGNKQGTLDSISTERPRFTHPWPGLPPLMSSERSTSSWT